MTLKELQKMIKEELESYNEADELDVAADLDAPEIDVDVDAGDIDVDGSEVDMSSDDVLRGIYDQLAAYFDTEDAEVEDFEDEDMPEEEPEGEFDDDGDAEEVDESSGFNGMNTTVTLQERFQKLANIIKG